MYQQFTFLSVACFIGLFTAAQNTKPVTAPTGRPVYNFTSINPNLQYVFIEDKPGTGHPQVGDDVMLRMTGICNNRFMYSSAALNKGKPAAFSLSKPSHKSDIMYVLELMTAGDSVICFVDAQDLYDHLKKKMPGYIKPGDKIQYNIRLVSIKPKAQVLKEQQEAIKKAMEGLEAKPNFDTNKLKPAGNR
jgi:hypothetical protein